MVEPETGRSDWENRFPGFIKNRIYLGDSIHYVISLSDKETITVFLKNRSSGQRQAIFSQGDKVYVSWLREDAIILKD